MKLTGKIHVIYVFMIFPVFWILLMSSKICINTSNNGLSHYFSKKRTVDFGDSKTLKVRPKKICY